MKMYAFNDEGFAINVPLIASPNFDLRPTNELSIIVIHNISLPPSQYGGNGIIELFTNQLNPDEHPYYREIYMRRVSAHFLIRRNGQLIQFVSCLKRAWHAGLSSWRGRENCNDFSIGIEIEGSDFEAFDSLQYLTLSALLKSLMSLYPIQDIVGHSDISPGRKSDPGPYFDWLVIKDISKNQI